MSVQSQLWDAVWIVCKRIRLLKERLKAWVLLKCRDSAHIAFSDPLQSPGVVEIFKPLVWVSAND